MGDLISLTIYDEQLYEEALEHYPGGHDHDQMKHGAWSPLSAHHKPQVHVKGAKKYNHLTIAAKQKLLATLRGHAQAKADAELKAKSASSGGGGSSGSSSTGKKAA